MESITDLRGLDPPEPLVRILNRLEAAGDGPHRFLLSRDPLFLYPLLARGGWRHSVGRGDAGFELTVFRGVRNAQHDVR